MSTPSRRPSPTRAPLALLRTAAALLALAGGAARAQSLQVSPIGVELPDGQASTVLTVTNQGQAPAALQIRAFAWSQSGPSDELRPTADIAVSPPITTVGPGEVQVFRLVVRQPPTGAEASYRLLIDQIPPPAAPGSVRVAMRLSIPVFLEPAAAVAAQVEWGVAAEGDGAILSGVNHGLRHVRLVDPVLTQGGGRLRIAPGETGYILPGAARRWRIQAGRPLPAGSALHFSAALDSGPVDTILHVAGR